MTDSREEGIVSSLLLLTGSWKARALTRSEGPRRKQLAPGGKHMACRGWGQKEDQGR